MDRRIGERQRWAWLAAGLSAAIAAKGCGFGWVWVAAAGLLVTGYYIYMDIKLQSLGVAAFLPRPLAISALLWLILLMAWTADLANGAFPMVRGYPVLGWTVLALAAWGARKGVAACARCAGVLCLFLAVLYGIIAVFAMPDVQIQYLLPAGNWQEGWMAVGLFLLPAAVWYLPCTRSKKRPAWQMALLIPLVSALLVAVTAGVLSPILARELPSSLYVLAQSVSLFGVVERIEPLLSAAMTMGVFCLVSVMACACMRLWGKVPLRKWSGVICCAAAAIIMKWVRNTDLMIVAAGNVVFGMLLPLTALWIGKGRKKRQEMVSGD